MTMLDEADDIAVATIVVAEYRAGTLLNDDPGRAPAIRAFLDEVLSDRPLDSEASRSPKRAG